MKCLILVQNKENNNNKNKINIKIIMHVMNILK